MNTLTSRHQQLQLQYQGFIQTQPLWYGQLKGLQQFGPVALQESVRLHPDDAPQRLGNRVEYFVLQGLAKQSHINILAHNLQIQQHKQTLGELDAILIANQKPIHMEMVYKFYLYDSAVGSTELEHWIGPNRKDTLVYKLDKLTQKQFPLLQRPETQPYLDKWSLQPQAMDQQVLFMAQLFVPKALPEAPLWKQLNPKAVMGQYLRLTDLEAYTHCSFYIPNKLDWLVMVHNTVSWLPYTACQATLEELLNGQRSPLLWIRHPNGQLERVFVVWW